ncbi:3-hydroxyacyl-CoA dehydrogenase [Microbacterium candidum]|uniref:3-hydroxyacyl-CoA dehydrogenase n=1 Tax=Microbacterium candidum TaxID=3041922 RepID=A0ABT7N047_9MICO|nr:3-hydroxyacyl-CoA dehydrogenase [Microbacterium sp. ASV49]MDL9980057.1 3-hydroxyacyl-CoA dehydrogenase [Microbacterium sp. ASV49]
MQNPRVCVVGAGSIGVAFAIVFARAGFCVRVWDALEDAEPRARDELSHRLELLNLPEEVADQVTFVRDLEHAVDGVVLVQECAPELLDVKRELFLRLAAASPRDAVFASSSSALLPTAIARGLEDDAASRVIVAHPGNPPYLIPVIELVPGDRTDPAVVDRASAHYIAAGLRPVRVNREIDGFIFNRLQGAVLREAYCLVRDGVATVEDIDEVVRSGLGRRWSFIGPFETVDLNTRGGIASHAEKMGPSYAAMGAERGQHDPWTSDLVAEVTAQRRAVLPSDLWAARVRWRDEQLARLAPIWDSIREGSIKTTEAHR